MSRLQLLLTLLAVSLVALLVAIVSPGPFLPEGTLEVNQPSTQAQTASDFTHSLNLEIHALYSLDLNDPVVRQSAVTQFKTLLKDLASSEAEALRLAPASPPRDPWDDVISVGQGLPS